MHQLKVEALGLLQNGGLWKYCNDAHETLQALCKHIWMQFSARGAQGRQHPILVVMQRHFMKTHLCTMEQGPHHLFQLQSEQKKMAEMKKLVEDADDKDWEL